MADTLLWGGYLLGTLALAIVAFVLTLSGARRHGYQPKEPISGPPYTPPGHWRDREWRLHKGKRP